jgi:hypothetical protein
MITGELKSKVDRIWDSIWSGGISNPLSVIEQLTYLLFIKRLDELHTLRERKAARTGKPIEEPIFREDQNALRWSRFREMAPEQMFATVKDKVFPFVKTLGSNGGTDERCRLGRRRRPNGCVGRTTTNAHDRRDRDVPTLGLLASAQPTRLGVLPRPKSAMLRSNTNAAA